MKKKIIGLLYAVLVLSLFAACGSGTENTVSSLSGSERNAGSFVDATGNSVTYIIDTDVTNEDETSDKAKEIKIGVNEMKKYKIYYKTTDYKAQTAAVQLADSTEKALGFRPEIKVLNGTEAEGEEIVFKVAEVNGLQGNIPFSVNCNEGTLTLTGNDYWGLCAAAEYIINEYLLKAADIPECLSYTGDAAGSYVFERSEGANLRIMTNNCWNRDLNSDGYIALGEDCSADARSGPLSWVYLAAKPDIICYQEMTPKMMSLLIDKMKKAGVNYKVLRREDKDFTSIIYNPDTVTLLDKGFHLFDYGNDSRSKGWTWGYFQMKESGEKFVALSTHWWWKSDSAEAGSSEMRRRQAAEIVEFANSLIEKYNCPVFVQGDFNTKTDTAAFKEIISGGFEDCHDIALSADDTSGYHYCAPAGYDRTIRAGTYASASIDHMTVKNKGEWKIEAFRQIVTDFYWPLSDHIPVYIDIKLS